MTAGVRLTLTALPVALAALLSIAPAAAQNTAQNTAQPAPVTNDTIGPSELRDFSLTGPARRNPPTIPPPQPSTTQPQARPTQPSTTPSRQPPATTTAPSGPARPATTASEPQRQPAAPSPAVADPSSSVTFDLPSTDSSAASPDPAAGSTSTLGSQPGLVPVTPPESASVPLNSGAPMWPWLLAALLAGGGIVYYGRRQRLRRASAGGPLPAEAAPEALARNAPPPRPAAPAPRPATPPPQQPVSSRIPGMIVSTRLRAQLDIQFIPDRLILDTERTTIRFAAMLLNSGNAPALDVLLEAAMFNAGASQDQEIGAFFAHPRGLGDRVPELPPLQTMTFRSEVTLPTSSLRLFEIEGRKLFVPLVGFNALYRWGGKDAQTSESFVVGVDTQSEKMGPFRLDTGPRQFRNIAARPHSVRLRK